MRKTALRFRTALLASVFFTHLAFCSQVSSSPKRSFKTVRASEKEMVAYFGISTNVFCTARDEGVDFKTAARIAISPVFGVIKELHGNQIPGSKEKLSKEELGKYVDNRLFVTASNACPKLFPKEVLTKVEKFKKEMETRRKKR